MVVFVGKFSNLKILLVEIVGKEIIDVKDFAEMIANGYDEIAILRLRAIEMSAHFGMPQDFEFKILHIF